MAYRGFEEDPRSPNAKDQFHSQVFSQHNFYLPSAAVTYSIVTENMCILMPYLFFSTLIAQKLNDLNLTW